MPFDLQEYPEFRPAHLDVYDRAFLVTVLRLAGVTGIPTELQRARAAKVLQQYRLRTAPLKSPRSVMHTALQSRLAQAAAAEQAFLFVRFDSVLPPGAAQLAAFNRWTGLFERAAFQQQAEDPDLFEQCGNVSPRMRPQ